MAMSLQKIWIFRFILLSHVFLQQQFVFFIEDPILIEMAMMFSSICDGYKLLVTSVMPRFPFLYVVKYCFAL
jgi:hypothetical protein